ncbi:MAG: indolepyruvate oxidoreductase subunit beta [Alphaproteobacteria bacterium]|nr:indolepyruvate oxidoreductase subunit beta [Alphaproteobacteria bacterium]
MTGITNIMIVGTGGQGVLTAAEILAEAAIAMGHDVKKTEVAGMAQRGGVVTSHLRFGPKVLAPAIAPGEADLMLAFEVAEGLRWIAHLRPGGLAIVNTMRLIPPVVSTGLYQYPDDPLAEARARSTRLLSLDAGAIAAGLGDPRLGNTVMLGAAADHLPFDPAVLRDCVLSRFRHKPGMAEPNERAFEAGRAATAAQSAA